MSYKYFCNTIISFLRIGQRKYGVKLLRAVSSAVSQLRIFARHVSGSIPTKGTKMSCRNLTALVCDTKSTINQMFEKEDTNSIDPRLIYSTHFIFL